MSSFSMNPVCAFSCHFGTVLCVAFVEQQRMLAFCRSYEVDVFIQCTYSPCVCVFLCECDNSNVWTGFNEICIDV